MLAKSQADNVLVLHAYVPGIRVSDQSYCWESLAKLQDARNFRIIHHACTAETSYAEGVNIALSQQPATLLTVEQDMEFSVEMVDELLACKEPCCGQQYWSMPCSSGKLVAIPNHDPMYPQCGLGLTKIDASVRPLSIPLSSYNEVESNLLKGVLQGVHVHFPYARHHHAHPNDDGGPIDSDDPPKIFEPAVLEALQLHGDQPKDIVACGDCTLIIGIRNLYFISATQIATIERRP